MDAAVRSDSEQGLGQTWLTPTYRADLRTAQPDVFVDESATDWSSLGWDEVGRPYLVDDYSRERRRWEEEHNRSMPVLVQWENFNRAFHDLFISDSEERSQRVRERYLGHLRRLNLSALPEELRELVQVKVWNKVHRIEDAVWDPRGKRALFEGLDTPKPRVLFLGAADGYEALQLLSMYPGGSAVLVDYDDFCRTDRYGKFPEAYPFLGEDPATGGYRVYHKEDLESRVEFVVDDIRNLDYGREFDLMLSVGLVEHFPDELKPEAFEWHRRFLKPGGYAILTTPRNQLRSKLFYRVMADIMNYGYRELMDARQLGLYAYENGFDVLRCGYIKAHNGVIARPR